MNEYHIGISIGSVNQNTAIVVVERVMEEEIPKYHLVKAERFLPGSTYPVIVARLKVFAEKLEGDRYFSFDITGVGNSVMKLIEEGGIEVSAQIVITNGISQGEDKGIYTVPKKDLVSAIQIPFQSGRIAIAASLPECEMIKSELMAFKAEGVKLKADPGSIDELWREKANDDYVLAAAVALWVAENLYGGSSAGNRNVTGPGVRIGSFRKGRRF